MTRWKELLLSRINKSTDTSFFGTHSTLRWMD